MALIGGGEKMESMVDEYLETNPDTLLLSQIKLQVELMNIYRPTLILFYSHRSNSRYS